jgi:cell division protein FtsL
VVIVAVVAVVLTIVGFHAVLAQNQVRLDQIRDDIAAAEARYDQARLENSQLSSPARITQRATEIGMSVPDVAPIAVPVPGAVPKRGSSSDVMEDWTEVKGNLDASP